MGRRAAAWVGRCAGLVGFVACGDATEAPPDAMLGFESGARAPEGGTPAPTDAGSPAMSDAEPIATGRIDASLPSTDVDAAIGTQSELSVLTYNVAGLPEGLSSSMPAVFMPLISPLLNGYPLVLVQEDFNYHPELASMAQHPHQSAPPTSNESFSSDGLNRFSDTTFDTLTRVRWGRCNGWLDSGSDCLADKGFSFARHTLPDGASLDVYNHHADAGRTPGDVQARTEQFAQLAKFIERHSAGHAVLLAGDTNLRGFDPENEPILQELLEATGLRDTCRSLQCDDEHLDRVLFRSGDTLTLEPLAWSVADEFVTDEGEPLSDHAAIHALFRYTALD